MHPEDALVVRGLLARDEAVFEALVRQLHGKLVAVARRLLGEHEAAEDVAQETWRRVLSSIATFEGKSRLASWIVQIAKNRAKTRLERRKREILIGDEGLDPTATWFDGFGQWRSSPAAWDTPESSLEHERQKQLLADALLTLPARQRVVVTLRDVEGMDAATASETLGISQENQRVLLHRGRAALRDAVAAAMRARPS